jgi:hypothetical protein
MLHGRMRATVRCRAAPRQDRADPAPGLDGRVGAGHRPTASVARGGERGCQDTTEQHEREEPPPHR